MADNVATMLYFSVRDWKRQWCLLAHVTSKQSNGRYFGYVDILTLSVAIMLDVL